DFELFTLNFELVLTRLPVAEPRELPAWISKRDGRLVPFEPDRISQALFAASEALGRADAFLARELADGVLHFVAQEFAATDTPTTVQIAELVAKVTRELGQPALAQVFARESERRARATLPGPAAAPAPSTTAAPKTAVESAVLVRFSSADAPDA